MAVGKTTYGKKIAAALGCTFLDLDEMIAADEQLSVSEIFKQKGEAYFRQVEAKALHKTNDLKNVVISCGGGTPCFLNNMEWMNNHGVVVHFTMPFGMLVSRLVQHKESRPLIADKNFEEIRIFAADNLNQRNVFYEKAAFTFDTVNDDLDKLIINLKSSF